MDLIVNNLPKILYLLLNIILLLCIFLYARQRIDKKSVFIIVLLNLFFPFSLTYNRIYYTEGYKGILFILLITAAYYLFFRNTEEKKFNIPYVILLVILSLIIWLRSIFMILVLLVMIVISINWARIRKIKEIVSSFIIVGALSSLLFFLKPVSIADYFILDKFNIPDIKSLVNNLFLFPRQNNILLILVIWLLFISIISIQGEKNKTIKKELLFILIPEIVISTIYLLLFSNNDFSTQGLYLGLFPFISLNIFYFYNYINKFSKKNRNIILIIFMILSFVELVLGKRYIYI